MDRSILSAFVVCLASIQAIPAWGHVVHLVHQVLQDGVVVEEQDEICETASVRVTPVAAPRHGYIFTHWSSTCEQGFANRDGWGRAYDSVNFTVYEATTNVAHYVSSVTDSDGDSLPDGAELYWYGCLDYGPKSDTDGDGYDLERELVLASNPHFSDRWMRGTSSVAKVPTLYRLVVRSSPELVIFPSETNNLAPGELVSTDLPGLENSSFAYWEINGIPQRDLMGRALDRLNFPMPSNDVEVVAVTEQDTSARVSLYWYGIPTVSMSEDTDGDGYTLSEETSLGLNPLLFDEHRAGVFSVSTSPSLYKCRICSDPDGVLFETQELNLAPGDRVETKVMSPGTSAFSCWKVNGVRQSDALGRSLDSLSFAMPQCDIVVVACCETNDEVKQSIYWYGTASVDLYSDTDCDGLTFKEELLQGTNPLLFDAHLRGIGGSSAEPELFKIRMKSSPEGVLFSSYEETVAQGYLFRTQSYSPTNSQFECWLLNGVECRDFLGRSCDNVEFVMPAGNVELVAVCIENEEARYSAYWHAEIGQGWASDVDGDGLTLKDEIMLGTNPLLSDAWIHGTAGSHADLQLFRCKVRSEPEGLLFDSYGLNLAPGDEVESPVLSAESGGFCGWYVNGLRQKDAFGRALDHVSLSMPSSDVEVVAATTNECATQMALYWYGDAGVSLDSDFDEDGVSFKEELQRGTNPLFADHYRRFGIYSAIGDAKELDLQHYEQPKGAVVDGHFSEIFTSQTWENHETGMVYAEGNQIWPVVADVDGDGLWDVVVCSAGGTNVFLNVGAQGTPEFVRSSGTDVSGVDLGMNSVDKLAKIGTDVPPVDALSATTNGTEMLVSDVDGRIWYYTDAGQPPSGAYRLQHKVWGGSHPGFASGLRLAAVDWDDDGDLDCLCGTADGRLILLLDPKVGRPTNLQALVGVDNVLLTWNPNVQSRVRGYKVYRADEHDDESAVVAQVPLPTYRDYPETVRWCEYSVSSVARYYTAGNSTPILTESSRSETVHVELGRVSLRWTDASTRIGEQVTVTLSIDNSANLSPGMTIVIDYDKTRLSLLKTVKSELFERDKIAPGAGKLYDYVFDVIAAEPGEAPIRVVSAEMSGVGGASVSAVLPEHDAVVTILARSESVAYRLGDVTGDGLVDENDLRLLAKLKDVTGRKYTAAQLKAGDFNGNGRLDNADYQQLRSLIK